MTRLSRIVNMLILFIINSAVPYLLHSVSAVFLQLTCLSSVLLFSFPPSPPYPICTKVFQDFFASKLSREVN